MAKYDLLKYDRRYPGYDKRGDKNMILIIKDGNWVTKGGNDLPYYKGKVMKIKRRLWHNSYRIGLGKRGG